MGEKRLELLEGEYDFSGMSEDERFQVMTRYLGDLCVFTKGLLELAASQQTTMNLIAKKMGIDLEGERMRIASERKAAMEAESERIKQEIEKIKEGA